MSLNKITLIGRLGKDPETRTTSTGSSFTILSLATNESWKDKQTGEKKEKVEWHSIVILNEKLATNASKYLHKGSQVYVEGQLQARKWKDKDGVEKNSTEIVLKNFSGQLIFLDFDNKAKGSEGAGQQRDLFSSKPTVTEESWGF